MLYTRSLKTLAVIFFTLVSAAALAHVDHGEPIGFAAGFWHPFTGVDHLMAMLAVGIWSALTAQRVWAAPLSFACLLFIGAVLGMQGLELPAVEPMIAASLLVMGLLLATRFHMPLSASSAVVGAFALFHGAAHGTELASVSPAAALLGMTAGTVLIHVAGILLGRFLIARHVLLARVVGGGVALFGVGLLAGIA
jgi:urease accessory protein